MFKQQLSSFKTNFKKIKLPSISRFIADTIISLKKKAKKEFKAHKNLFTGFLITIIVLLAVSSIYMGINVYKNYQVMETVLGEKQKVISNISYWENVVETHKGYRDGYFNLALLYYRLKDFQKSKENLDKVLEIDPNFEKGRELGKLLQ